MAAAELAEWERRFLKKQAAEQEAANRQRAQRRYRLGSMPAKFEDLAVYNAECSRGIVHTPGYDAAMAELQRQFNEWVGL
jgi:hypothetical protein